MSVMRSVFPEFSRMMQAFERDAQQLQRQMWSLDPTMSGMGTGPSTLPLLRETRGAFGIEGSTWPAVDFREQEAQYVLEAELPGLRKEDVSVDLDSSGKILTLSGQIQQERHKGEKPSKTDETPASTSAAAETGTVAAPQRQTAVGPASSVGRYWAQERFYGHFSRTIRLPHPVKAKEVHATFQDGVLHVTLPKQQPSESATHHVQIEAGTASE
jgi:HSP20 family molecular chaperone IbpA